MNLKHGAYAADPKKYKAAYMRMWRLRPETKAWRRDYDRARRERWRVDELCGMCGKEQVRPGGWFGERCLKKKLVSNKTEDRRAKNRAYKRTPRVVAYNRQYKREHQQLLKVEVFKHYGSRCRCCGEAELRFLSIDHTNGWRTIPSAPRSGRKLYAWLKGNDYPDGFQSLCFNCNFAKGHFGSCPHQPVEAYGACLTV